MKGKTIVVGITGSIAAFKSAEIVSKLVQNGANVFVIMTESATKFVTPLTFQALTRNYVVVDEFELAHFNISHISLSEKADLLIIAPATANFIGKVANGIADNGLTATFMSVRCPVLIAPCMNEKMYLNKITQENIKKLKNLGYKIIEPEKGWLACGIIGIGRLASIEKILEAVEKEIK